MNPQTLSNSQNEHDASADPEHPIELPPRRARGARRGLPVLYVLVFSTALAVVVLLAIWFGFPRRALTATAGEKGSRAGRPRAAVIIG